MSNSQPPNDPNLDRDLWGDEEPYERPQIDLKRKQGDDLETSNWDDADDYGREYDEVPGYGAGAPSRPASPDPEPETLPPSDREEPPYSSAMSEPQYPSAASEPSVNFGDPELFEEEPFESNGEPVVEPAEPVAEDRLAPESMPAPEPSAASESVSERIPEPAPTEPAPPTVAEDREATARAELRAEPAVEPVAAPEPEPDLETTASSPDPSANQSGDPSAEVAALRTEVAELRAQKSELQSDLRSLARTSLQDLEARRQKLQVEVERLERRQARIQAEMRTTFAGSSQELAVRVQGFKEYLIGSLQDLSVAAERLQLAPKAPPTEPPAASSAPPRSRPRRDRTEPARTSQDFTAVSRRGGMERSDGRSASANRPPARDNSSPSVPKQGFQDRTDFIRAELDRYRDRPDYYGPSWQLRRTFQPVQAERVSDWFFSQGGRGVVRSMGSRLQNILVASTAISILRAIHDKRVRTLVLANTPERLGEWRRGLQDCLGITRDDFGPDRGITLFEDPMLMAQKAERLIKAGWLPLIVMDESEAQLNLSLLQFPMWLAFASDPTRSQSYDRDWLVR